MDAIVGKKKIGILVGAGISASAGIPTFRGANGLLKGQFKEIFDGYGIRANSDWKKKTNDLVNLKNEVFEKILPTPFHLWMKKIDESDQLVGILTMNIDGLEEKAGIKKEKIIYLHGRIDKLRCNFCNSKVKINRMHERLITKNWNNYCYCAKRNKLKRQIGLGRFSTDVVLYGDTRNYNISEQIERFLKNSKLDLLIIAGASLSKNVAGTMDLVRSLKNKLQSKNVLYVNPHCYSKAYKDMMTHLPMTSDEFSIEATKHSGVLRNQKFVNELIIKDNINNRVVKAIKKFKKKKFTENMIAKAISKDDRKDLKNTLSYLVNTAHLRKNRTFYY